MTSRSEIRSIIVKLIAIELDVDETAVATARSLRQDLAMDSVAAANLFFALEEECCVELNLERVESVDTVVEIEQLVADAMALARVSKI